MTYEELYSYYVQSENVMHYVCKIKTFGRLPYF